MYVVIARGDRYENCNYDQDWELNLFCTPDESFAKRFVDLLRSNKTLYLQELTNYKLRESGFINEEMLSKFETYFETGISFVYRELEIFLPPQQDGNNKEHA